MKTGSLVILPGFPGQSCHLSTDLTVGGSPSQRLDFDDFLLGIISYWILTENLVGLLQVEDL